MPEGVQFTKASARRIATTVKEIESRPFPQNVLQRRRAGGLGRSTLWEVTAVQTTPETVTIKRVENQDGDLIAASEKTDILYDPDNEPAVGDRGLLIRLGEGSLFFFRRAANIIRVYPSEWARIADDSPNSTLDYKSSGTTLAKTNAREDNLVYKFASPINIDISLAGLYQRAIFSTGGPMSSSMTHSDTPPGAAKTVGITYPLYAIKDDFDCSAVTWNSPPTNLTNVSGYVSRGKGLPGDVIQFNTSFLYFRFRPIAWPHSVDVYGFILKFGLDGAHNATTYSATWGGPGAINTLSWFEYDKR